MINVKLLDGTNFEASFGVWENKEGGYLEEDGDDTSNIPKYSKEFVNGSLNLFLLRW